MTEVQTSFCKVVVCSSFWTRTLAKTFFFSNLGVPRHPEAGGVVEQTHSNFRWCFRWWAVPKRRPSWSVASRRKSVVRRTKRFLCECVWLAVFSASAEVAPTFFARVCLTHSLNYVLDFAVCFTTMTTVNKEASMIGCSIGTVIIIFMCVVQSGWTHQTKITLRRRLQLPATKIWPLVRSF